MDIYHYTCKYCGKEYKPKRRRVQKYCCTSCKNNSYNLKKKNDLIIIPENKLGANKPLQIEKMSIAGVGNAAAGAAVVKFAEILFTSEAHKPATKNDLRNLEAKILKRYYPVKNWPQNNFGKKPYFDIVQSCIIYF